MGCSWRVYISAYVDGELSPEKRTEVEEHLKFCEECRSEKDFFERLKAVKMLLEPPSEPGEEEWRTCFEGAMNRRRVYALRRVFRLSLAWGGGLTVAAAFLILIALMAVQKTSPSHPQITILKLSGEYSLLREDGEDATVIRLVEKDQFEQPSLEILDYGGRYIPVQIVADDATIIRLVDEEKLEGR